MTGWTARMYVFQLRISSHQPFRFSSQVVRYFRRAGIPAGYKYQSEIRLSFLKLLARLCLWPEMFSLCRYFCKKSVI